MYRNKRAGPDGILSEMMSDLDIHKIRDVINEIFNIGHIAEDFSKSNFVILHTRIGATP